MGTSQRPWRQLSMGIGMDIGGLATPLNMTKGHVTNYYQLVIIVVTTIVMRSRARFHPTFLSSTMSDCAPPLHIGLPACQYCHSEDGEAITLSHLENDATTHFLLDTFANRG